MIVRKSDASEEFLQPAFPRILQPVFYILFFFCLVILSITATSTVATDSSYNSGTLIIPALPTPRNNLAAVFIDPYIIVLGGFNTKFRATNTVEVLNINNWTWYRGAAMPRRRDHLCAAVVGSKVYAIGGVYGRTAVEVFDINERIWTSLEDLVSGVIGAGLVAVGDSLYLIGGFRDGTVSNLVQRYDVHTKVWSTLPPLPTPRSNLAVVVVDNLIIALGGISAKDETLNIIEVFDTSTETWISDIYMPHHRSYFSAVLIRNHLCVIGGKTGIVMRNDVDCAFVKSTPPKNWQWNKSGKFLIDPGRFGHSAVTVRDNNNTDIVLVIGGYRRGESGDVEIWNDEAILNPVSVESNEPKDEL